MMHTLAPMRFAYTVFLSNLGASLHVNAEEDELTQVFASEHLSHAAPFVGETAAAAVNPQF